MVGAFGILAQLGEHLPYKQRVTGSSPVGPTQTKVLIEYGEVAQLARAHGSYPWCRGFESPLRYCEKQESEGFLFFVIKRKNRTRDTTEWWRGRQVPVAPAWRRPRGSTHCPEKRIPPSLLKMGVHTGFHF